jgi:hypothetical protein
MIVLKQFAAGFVHLAQVIYFLTNDFNSYFILFQLLSLFYIVSINVKTNRRGFCPGESIALNALFENNSNRSVTPIANLYQVQTYNNANGKQFVATHKLATITGLAIAPATTNEWNSKLLKIPNASPTINSILIKVEYFVKISLLIPGSYTLSCVLPIVLGTIPFNGYDLYSLNESATSSRSDGKHKSTIIKIHDLFLNFLLICF